MLLKTNKSYLKAKTYLWDKIKIKKILFENKTISKY